MKNLIASLSLLLLSFSSQKDENWSFKAHWNSDPSISICSHDIEIEDVKQASLYWKERGLINFKEIKYDPDCKTEPPWGYIYLKIDDSKLDKEENGATERSYSTPQMIMRSAVILIRSDLIREEELLIHEIGHSIGLLHNEEDRDSVMFPYRNYDAISY